MQHWIGCTMLCTGMVRAWSEPWVTGLMDSRLRVRIVDVGPGGPVGTDTAGMGAVVDAIRAQVQGSHLCLLPVCADNLSWVRTLLSQAAKSLSVPIMAVTHDLKAVALRDLLMLGVADFIRVPGCPEELRVRVERVLASSRTAQLDTLSRWLGTSVRPVAAQTVGVAEDASGGGYAGRSAVRTDGKRVEGMSGTAAHGAAIPGATGAGTCMSNRTDKANAACDGTVRAYVMGRLVSRKPDRAVEMARTAARRPAHFQPISVLLRDAASQHRLTPCNVLELEAFAAATAARYALDDAPFKQAKSRMIEDFEKAYLIAMLNRHGGNITHAAKAAQKHRRAFWELIRKHRIDIPRPG